MTEIKTEEKQNVPQKELINNISLESKIQLVFLGFLSISFIVYFALRGHWVGFVFAHVAAFSIMGFYGCLAGAIARMKGYGYWRAFKTGFFIPIILGAISAFLIVPDGERSLPLTCGGWTALAAGIIVVIIYSFIKKKYTTKNIEAEVN